MMPFKATNVVLMRRCHVLGTWRLIEPLGPFYLNGFAEQQRSKPRPFRMVQVFREVRILLNALHLLQGFAAMTILVKGVAIR